MRLLRRYLTILLIAFSLKAGATHIVGGEIYYDYLGGNNYQLTLKVYRDCFNGTAPYDDPASIGVFDANGTLVNALSIPFPGSVILPNTLNSPCFSPPTNVCVEEAIYTTTVNLPPLTGGYYLAYQRCCRNNTILNLVSPGSVGSTYMAYISGPETVTVNSSPRYNNFPPIFLCLGNPLNFDHSATDLDGDSLAYELCDPYDGADPSLPQPVPPAGPPYSYVPFTGPYSGGNPMSANPALSIDPHTGLLTGTPNSLGQWVVGVCVKEYRNGQLLSINKRDFQFNVVNCPGLIVSSVPSQQIFCFGYTVNFLNNTFNGSYYHWDFGDPTATNDTSNLVTPVWTYADSGVYNVMLVANPGSPCADTGYTSFYIYPLLQPTVTAPPGQCLVGNSFDFTAGGSFLGNGTFDWTFGTGSTPATSTQQNPAGITYNAPGTYPVTLTVTENNCTQTASTEVTVYPMPTADFNAAPVTGCVPFGVQFSDSSISGTTISYLWDFGDGSSPSTLANPYHVYTQVGVYDVTLTISTTNGCIATNTFTVPGMVTVEPIPTAGFIVDPTETSIFNPVVTVTDQSVNSIGCTYLFGNGDAVIDQCNYVYSYPDAGLYTISQVVTNSYGCTDTAYATVDIKHEYRFWIPNAYTPNSDGLNEVFKPAIMGVEDYSFMIFDRWGELIYKTDNYRDGWDGTYKGRKCQEDVYVYKIDFRDLVEFKEHHFIGHVTIVR
jgi:gliding motility-associated-like protein